MKKEKEAKQAKQAKQGRNKRLPRFMEESQFKKSQDYDEFAYPPEALSVSAYRERKKKAKGHLFNTPQVNKYSCGEKPGARQSPALFGFFLVTTILATLSATGLLLAFYMKRRTSKSHQISGTSK